MSFFFRRLQEALAESADEKRQLRGEIVEIQQQFMEERTAFEVRPSQVKVILVFAIIYRQSRTY